MDPKEIERLALQGTPPARLGRYVVLGRLGYGGMAQIFLARAIGKAGFEKLVVIKRLHDHLIDEPMLVQMFLDEARLAARLNHANVVQTFDVGIEGSSYFLVMEYIEGQNLAHIVRYAKKYDRYPSPEFWAALMVPLLDGLHHAHTLVDPHSRPLNIVHRDISPQNILVSYDGTPKLVDFGIAKATQRTVQTASGTLKGKYTYMSPEQCLSEELDSRSDIFSAGTVLYELCTGTRLFKDRTDLRIVQRILSGNVCPPHVVNPMLHPRLGETILRALKRRREDRWQTASDFRDAIENDLAAVRYRLRKRDISEFLSDIFQDVIEFQRRKVEELLREQCPPGEPLPEINPAQSTPSPSMKLPDVLYQEKADTSPSGAGPEVEGEESTRSLHGTTHSGAARLRTETSDIGSPRRNGARSWIIAVAAAVSLLAGAAVLLAVMFWRPPERNVASTDDKDRYPGAEVDTRDARRDPANRATTATPGEEKRTKGDETPDGDGDEAPGTGRVADSDRDRTDVDKGTEPDTKAADKSAKPVEKPVLHKGRRKPRPGKGVVDGKRPATAAAVTAAPVTTRPPATAALPTAGDGYLTLKTIPWTEVYLGKKKLGDTPLVRFELPAGRVELLLVNAAEGIRYSYSVRILPGEETFKKLGLK